MIIPVRCFTCGAVISDRWEAYIRREAALLQESSKARQVAVDNAIERDHEAQPSAGPSDHGRDGSKEAEPASRTRKEREANPELLVRGQILDDLHINRLCCRRHFLGNVDLMDEL